MGPRNGPHLRTPYRNAHRDRTCRTIDLECDSDGSEPGAVTPRSERRTAEPVRGTFEHQPRPRSRGRSVARAHRLPARPRPHSPHEGVSAAEAQDPGVHLAAT